MSQFSTRVNHVYYFKTEEDIKEFLKDVQRVEVFDLKQSITGPHPVVNKDGLPVYPAQSYWTLTVSYWWGEAVLKAYGFDETSPTYQPPVTHKMSTSAGSVNSIYNSYGANSYVNY